MGAVALVTHLLLHMSWPDGLLIGAALGSTSGSVVLPVLQQIEASEPVKVSLTLEASLGEIIAVIVVGTLLTLGGTGPLVSGLVVGFSRHVITDVALGVAAGLLWSRIWPRVATHPFVNALNLGVVLTVFSVARYLGGSGLLAELIFGLTLANVPRTPHMARLGARMAAFHSEFTFLVRSLFFVLLGIMAQLVGRRYVVPIIAILVSLLLARFLAVSASRWAIRSSTSNDAELLFLMMPRGLITAVLALEIAADRGDSFAFLPAMAFTAVLATNLLVIGAAVRCRSSLQLWDAGGGQFVPASLGAPAQTVPVLKTGRGVASGQAG
jgi:cell volume regulation protein A